MKIATVCSGIGSPEQAIRNLNIPHEIPFACEIDKYARQTYLANFIPNHMYTDMTKEEWDRPEQYADLFIGGIPCQAFSLAGKRLGELDKRGLLFYDFYRYVKNQQPKVFIIENVKGLLSDNGGKTFQNWIQLLGKSMNQQNFLFTHDDSLMYNLHFEVLNSKDFGVPQNRERVFLIGVRNDLPNTFRFPPGFRLTKRLKDILEPEVDEKYYLSEKMLAGFNNHSETQKSKGNGFKFEPITNTDTEIASCVTARVFKMGVDDNYIKEVGKLNSSQDGRVFDTSGISQCLSSGNNNSPKIVEPIAASIRGRYPENPKSRVSGLSTKQMLEINPNRDVTNTITTVQKDNVVIVKEATKIGFAIAEPGDSINLSNPNSETRRGRVGKGIANTLDTACNQAVVESVRYGKHQQDTLHFEDGLMSTIVAGSKGSTPHHTKTLIDQRIRRLTPLECFRLQGFPDEYVKPCSDSQTYKQAGNSITVNVMQAIIERLLHLL